MGSRAEIIIHGFSEGNKCLKTCRSFRTTALSKLSSAAIICNIPNMVLPGQLVYRIAIVRGRRYMRAEMHFQLLDWCMNSQSLHIKNVLAGFKILFYAEFR